MGVLIEKYTGKSKKITIEDLNENFGGIDENFELEFKRIMFNQSEDDRKRTILDPLVSFLNSSTGHGLLGIGVKTFKRRKTFEALEGVEGSSPCKSRAEIESLINTYIDSVPLFTSRYVVEIQKIEFNENKNIFLIEIERKDNFCVYYSKYDHVSSIREADNSNKLSLRKFFELVSEKSFPKIYVDFKQNSKFLANEIILNPLFINEGFKPAANVHIIMIICYNDSDLKINVDGSYLRGYGDVKRQIKQLKLIGLYKFIDNYKYSILRGVPVIHPINQQMNPDYLYPFAPSQHIINIHLTKKNFEITTVSLIYEENSLTTQITRIEYTEGRIKIEDVLRDIKPYYFIKPSEKII